MKRAAGDAKDRTPRKRCGVERVFLGWDRPLCETVPERLLPRRANGTVDLRGTVVVTPTRQASRRLRAALPAAAHERLGAALLGPEIVTAPVLLAPRPCPGRASDLECLLAWCTVLKTSPPGDLDSFLGEQRPGGTAWAMQVARRLTGLRRELADGGLSIAEVAGGGAATEEAERWAAMAELESRYATCLRAWGLRDPISDQLAHARAGDLPAETKRVLLAAVPDPPGLLVALLQAWAETGGTVEILVAAPEREAGAFDDWGRPVPEAWQDRGIPLDDRDIVLAADPEDQAACIAGLLRDALAERPDTDGDLCPGLAIGVPDRETVPPLQRELAALGMPAFDPQNRLFAETAVFRLVQSLLAWRDRDGYAETAALLRHPDVLAALPAADDVLRHLDTIQPDRLPVSFADLRKAAAAAPALLGALERLDEWRGMLAAKPLSDALRDVLQSVYARRMLLAGEPADNAFLEAVEAADAALRELAAAEETGRAGEEAPAALLARLQAATVKPERAGERLDLEGWLELGWNPAPVLCVAGMNEGLVPDGGVGDLFLPDSLRGRLGLRDDRARAARDAYLLTALCAQRSRDVRPDGRVVLLAGKRSASGDPLRPSRLLFRCPDESLVARARRLFRDPPPVHTAAAYSLSFALDPARVPAGAVGTALPERISPTAFGDYLECPFRFYLRHVLGMAPSDDRSREPDPRGFGTLCHEVVEAMAADEGRIWACGDADALAAWLDRRLRAEAAARYGARPWLGVTLAVESAARRLRAFATQQVAWHAQGWEIVERETKDEGTSLDGAALVGRIDRIDRNRDGRVCVLDYKTSDKAHGPAEVHLAAAGNEDALPEAVVPAELLQGTGGRKGARPRRWADLQLPLYREMVRARYGDGALLGYILLPAALGETAFALWDGYGDALHAHALRCAAAVLRRIREAVFWPPAARAPRPDDFADLVLGDAGQCFRPPPNPWQVRAGAADAGGAGARARRNAP